MIQEVEQGQPAPRPAGETNWLQRALAGLRRLAPLLWLLILLPMAHTWFLAEKYSINAPLSDDWVLVGEGLALYEQGKLDWNFFWEPFISSRSPIPKLYGVGMALLTHWDVKVGVRTTLVLTFVGLLAVVFLLRRQKVLGLGEQVLFAMAASLLLFTPYQQTQWLITSVPPNQMGLAPVIWAFAIWCTEMRVRWKLLISIALGMFASFSFVTGMLIWVIMPLLILLWSPPRFKARLLNCGLWLVAFGVTMALYLEGGFRPKQKSMSPLAALERWPEIVQYVLTFLGGPVAYLREGSDYRHLAPVMTALFLLTLAGLALWRWRYFLSGRGFRLALPWLAMMGFAGATAAMLSLGRLDDPDTVLLNRYQMYSCWFYIGWLGVARLAFTREAADLAEPVPLWHPRAAWALPCALPVAALVGFAGYRFQAAYVEGVDKMPYRHYNTAPVVGSVQFMKVAPDHELLTTLVWGDPAHVYRIAPVLNEHGYLHPGMLEHAELARNKRVETGAEAARYQGAMRVGQREPAGALVAEGWAIDTRRKTPASMIVLSIEEAGRPEVILGYNADRVRDKETMKKFKGRVMNGRYGWTVRVPGNKVPDAPFRLRAYAYDTRTQEFFRLIGEVDIPGQAPDKRRPALQAEPPQGPAPGVLPADRPAQGSG